MTQFDPDFDDIDRFSNTAPGQAEPGITGQQPDEPEEEDEQGQEGVQRTQGKIQTPRAASRNDHPLDVDVQGYKESRKGLRGRPKEHHLTREVANDLCQWIEEGGTITRWSERNGISVSTINNWMRDSAVFYEQVHRSRKLRTHAHVEQVLDQAADATADDNITVAQVKARELSSKYRVWLAGLLNRADYGPQDAKVSTNVTFNIDLTSHAGATHSVTVQPAEQGSQHPQQSQLSRGLPVSLPRPRSTPLPTPLPPRGPRDAGPGHEDS